MKIYKVRGCRRAPCESQTQHLQKVKRPHCLTIIHRCIQHRSGMLIPLTEGRSYHPDIPHEPCWWTFIS